MSHERRKTWKGQLHEIFALGVLSSINPTYWALIHGLKSFCIWPNYSPTKIYNIPSIFWNRFGGVIYYEIFHTKLRNCETIQKLHAKFQRGIDPWLSKRLAWRIRSHMRNGFNPIGGVDWWKNWVSKISCNCPFKSFERFIQIRYIGWNIYQYARCISCLRTPDQSISNSSHTKIHLSLER
jgi:hypothetical protein